MSMFFRFTLLAVAVVIGAAQQQFLTILEYTDAKCTIPAFGFAFTTTKCMTLSASSSMTIAYTASTGAVIATTYTTTGCTGTGSPTTYTVSSACTALSTSGLYYTTTTNSFSTLVDATAAVGTLGAGAVVGTYQDSLCTQQSTAVKSTSGLPSEVSMFLLFICVFVC